MQIRPLVQSDREQIEALLSSRDGADAAQAARRTDRLFWVAFHNPCAGKRTTYFVAEDEGRIVGHLGRMPMDMVVDGKLVPAYFAHDLFVAPDYREGGKGFFLSMSLYRSAEQASDNFCYMLWMTQVNLDIQRRRGYREIAIDRYLRPLDPCELVGKKLRNPLLVRLVAGIGRLGLNLVDRLLLALPRLGAPAVVSVDRFDRRYDDLLRRILPRIGVCSRRSSRYLNWKYVDQPHCEFTRFAAESDTRVRGFLVLVESAIGGVRRAEIVDLMADPEDSEAVAALVRAALSHCRAQGLSSIFCILSDQRMGRVLRRHLFLPTGNPEPVILANAELYPGNPLDITTSARLQFTGAESDGHMFD